jgi:SRSO17 transposase
MDEEYLKHLVADSAYGDQDGFRAELAGAGLPFVMALKPRRGTWAYGGRPLFCRLIHPTGRQCS